MAKQYAFIDEYGNYGFNFDNIETSTHFIVTAILVDEKNIEELDNKLEYIRKKYFQTGEMKSSSVSKNDRRRLLILNEISKLNFHIYSFVIDKREILKESGLQYKRSFYKFLNGLLYNELYSTFPNLKIISDEHGSKEFMESFKKYVSKRHIPNLFNESEFGFINSKNNVIIQLADFISGTLAKGHDEHKKSKMFEEFFKPIKDKVINIVNWPGHAKSYFNNIELLKDKEINEIIAELSINLAKQFIDKNLRSKNIYIKMQVRFLKFLLFYLRYINPKEYITSKEIIRNISVSKKNSISVYALRTKIVAPLRDNGVLISSSREGYKLPINEEDIIDFVEHTNSIISPMLSRLGIARNKLLLVTKNELDILNYDKFTHLKSFYDINYKY